MSSAIPAVKPILASGPLPVSPQFGVFARPALVAPEDPATALRLIRPGANPSQALAAAFESPPAEPMTKTGLRAGMVREMERVSGHSLAELVQIQRRFICDRANRANTTPANYMRRLAQSQGMGGNTAATWLALSEAEQQGLRARFETMVAKLRASAPAELVRLLDEAEAAGGGLRFEPQRCEVGGALGAYAFADGPVLGASLHFLEDAEADISSVYANISHELGGHWKYGETVSWEITEGVLEGMTSRERQRAMTGERTLHSVYGYPETEIDAELHEMSFPGSPRNDPPRADIVAKLSDLKNRFAPEVAKAIVCGLRWRVRRDPTVTPEARDFLDQSIRRVFRLRFVTRNAA